MPRALSAAVEAVAGGVAEDVVERRVRSQIALELGGRAFGLDAPEVHQGDAVAEQLGLLHVVGRQQDGHARRLLQLLHPLPHAVARHRIEAHRRLVEHEHARPVDERLRELEPAHHAARVGAREAVGDLFEAHHVEGVVDARPCARRAGRRTAARTR